MLCTAKSDTFCPKLSCLYSILWCISIGPNFKFSELVSPCHDTSKLTTDCSIYSRNDSVVNSTCRTIYRNLVAFVICLSSKNKLLVLLIHIDCRTSGYAACTHTSCNYCSVACHTAANSKYTLCRLHTLNIFRRCFKSNKYNLLSSCVPFLSILSSKYNLTAGSSWRCSKGLSYRSCSLKCLLVELWMKKCI